MASVDAAINKPAPTGVVRKHRVVEEIAGHLISLGATEPSRAIEATLIAKTYAHTFNMTPQAIYKLLRERPGFVQQYSPAGLLYYYEADRLRPLAEMQGAKFYPKDLSPLWVSATPQQCNHVHTKKQADDFIKGMNERPDSKATKAINFIMGLEPSPALLNSLAMYLHYWSAELSKQED